ncbi:MAG TPA: hypothetical protein VGG03_11045 [Thermoanaerobaculia bacterium]
MGGAVLSVLLLACQQKSPEEKLLKSVEPAGSWVAALEMVGQKWAANSVPTSFVKNSVSAAGKEFEKVAREAAKSQARPELRAAVRGLVAEAQAAGEGLKRAVEANDRGAVARDVGRLSALRARFETLTKGGEAVVGGS